MIYSISLENVPHPRYQNLVRMDNWCKENCVGEWQSGGKNQYGIFDIKLYCFDESGDAVAFKLRWS